MNFDCLASSGDPLSLLSPFKEKGEPRNNKLPCRLGVQKRPNTRFRHTPLLQVLAWRFNHAESQGVCSATLHFCAPGAARHLPISALANGRPCPPVTRRERECCCLLDSLCEILASPEIRAPPCPLRCFEETRKIFGLPLCNSVPMRSLLCTQL